MKIFCVIPALNEEKKIVKVVNEASRYVDKVIVVNDGSDDQTATVLKKTDAIILNHIINRGQGASLQTGNEFALQNGADIVVHFDADGQFLATEIDEVVKPLLNNEYDIVFGSRFLGKKSKLPFWKEYIIIPIAHLVNKIILGQTLSDPQSGFRALNKKALQTINIQQRGMAHCSEIIYKAFDNKLRIKEIPITVIYDEFGQSFKGGIRIIKDLLLAKLLD
jgi:glycosyltransferase involved in cell wall biosynthesis